MHRDDEGPWVTNIGFLFEAVIFLALFFGLPVLGFLLYIGGQP